MSAAVTSFCRSTNCFGPRPAGAFAGTTPERRERLFGAGHIVDERARLARGRRARRFGARRGLRQARAEREGPVAGAGAAMPACTAVPGTKQALSSSNRALPPDPCNGGPPSGQPPRSRRNRSRHAREPEPASRSTSRRQPLHAARRRRRRALVDHPAITSRRARSARSPIRVRARASATTRGHPMPARDRTRPVRVSLFVNTTARGPAPPRSGSDRPRPPRRA